MGDVYVLRCHGPGILSLACGCAFAVGFSLTWIPFGDFVASGGCAGRWFGVDAALAGGFALYCGG